MMRQLFLSTRRVPYTENNDVLRIMMHKKSTVTVNIHHQFKLDDWLQCEQRRLRASTEHTQNY